MAPGAIGVSAEVSTVHGRKGTATLLFFGDCEAIIIKVVASALLPSFLPGITSTNELKAVLVNGTRVFLLPLSLLEGDLLSEMTIHPFRSGTNLGRRLFLTFGTVFQFLSPVLDLEAVVGFHARIAGVGTSTSEIELAAESRLLGAFLFLNMK